MDAESQEWPDDIDRLKQEQDEQEQQKPWWWDMNNDPNYIAEQEAESEKADEKMEDEKRPEDSDM